MKISTNSAALQYRKNEKRNDAKRGIGVLCFHKFFYFVVLLLLFIVIYFYKLISLFIHFHFLLKMSRLF